MDQQKPSPESKSAVVRVPAKRKVVGVAHVRHVGADGVRPHPPDWSSTSQD